MSKEIRNSIFNLSEGGLGGSYWTPKFHVSNAGNDASDGLTPLTAWQTIAKVNATSFVAGDMIGFKRGDKWREQLTIPSSGDSSNPITFGAYGTGAKPIIDGSEILSSWTSEVVGVGSVIRETQETISNQEAIFMYSNRTYVATELFAAGTYDLTKIEVNLSKVGSPTMIITAYLYSNIAGNPTNLLTTSTNTLNASTITNGAWHAFNFDGTFEVQNGTQYWIVLKASGVSDVNYVGWNDVDWTGSTHVLADADGTGTWGGMSVGHGSFKITGYSEQFTCYYATSTITNVKDNNNLITHAVWEDDIILLHKLTKLSLAPGSYFSDGANSRIYVRTSGNDNVSGYEIRAAIREFGIYNNNRACITIDGLHIKKINAHGIMAHTSAATGMVISTCEIDDCGVGIAIVADNALITHNNIHDLDHMVYEDGGSGDYGGEAIILGASNCEVSYNNITNCRSLSLAFGHDGGFMEFYVPGSTSSGNNIHHNIITNCDIFFESGGTIETTLMHHNIWVNTVGSSLFSIHNEGITNSEFCLYNNTFYSVAPTTVSWAFSMGASNGFILKNNIFYFSNYEKLINRTDFDHTYNCYYGGHGDLTLGVGEIDADPLFTINGSNFHLQVGSPAINAGLDVGLTEDYEGNPIVGVPDVGAYEKQ